MAPPSPNSSFKVMFGDLYRVSFLEISHLQLPNVLENSNIIADGLRDPETIL